MVKKSYCKGCKYLYGSERRPECDWYDEPVGNINNCMKKEITNGKEKAKESKLQNT